MNVLTEHGIDAICLANRVHEIVEFTVRHGCGRCSRVRTVRATSGYSGASSQSQIRRRRSKSRVHPQRHFIHLLEVTRVQDMVGIGF